MEELGTKTYILSVLEGKSIVSMLFIGGVFSFMKRERLLEERATPASAVEIARKLSSMIQFNIALRTGGKITNAYLCGLSPEEEYFCGDMSSSLEIDVGTFPKTPFIMMSKKQGTVIKVQDYLYALGGMM